MTKIIPVILAGGEGTRLWPLSQAARPKPFIAHDGGARSLLQQTIARVAHQAYAPPLIVCNADHTTLLAEHARDAAATFLLEPCPRNTAPALAAAALHIQKQHGNDALMLALPCDHTITDPTAFQTAIEAAVEHAATGAIVAFGITPTHPETTYGYIRYGSLQNGAAPITAFIEKPDAVSAQSFIATHDYLWNSGMFMARPDTYLHELQQHQPDIITASLAAYESKTVTADYTRLDPSAFALSPSLSIDRAVMEHTQKGVVIPLACGWSDAGSWDLLWQHGNKDADGNVLIGQVQASDATGNYIRGDGIPVTACGVEGLIIVATPEGVLVTRKSSIGL